MRRIWTPLGRGLGSLVLLAALLPLSGAASAQDSGEGWTFTTLPFADLWFHGMALVDPIGPGPNPLYDPAYPARVRRARAEAYASPASTNSGFDHFREIFRRDPSFEVMHFVPLYFSRAGRTETFTALALLARTETGIPPAPSPRTSFGLAALGSVLNRPDQRRILGEFVQALEKEWEASYGGRWQRTSSKREKMQRTAESIWRSRFALQLAPILQPMGVDGGMVAMVPALGVEGRIFLGSPGNPADNVLMVTAPEEPDAAGSVVYAMLRELSFPFVRRVLERAGGTGSGGIGEERVAANAAVRFGALILEKYLPKELSSYQQYFLSQAGISAPANQQAVTAFQETYPLNGAMESALREAIVTTTTLGGTR